MANSIFAEVTMTRLPGSGERRKGYVVTTTGHGYTFFCEGHKVSQAGNTYFGGYVAPVRPNKDVQTTAEYYIKFIVVDGRDFDMRVMLTKVYHSNGETVFDEDIYATGIMYASGDGQSSGVLFEPDSQEAPAPVETVPQVQNRKKAKHADAVPLGTSPDKKVSLWRTGRQKRVIEPEPPTPDDKVDYDDIPF